MSCIFCGSINESKDCIVCSRCSNHLIGLMNTGKLKEAYDKAISKGYTQKSEYIQSLMEETNVQQSNRKFNSRRGTYQATRDQQKYIRSAKKGISVTVSSGNTSEQTLP